MPEVQLVTLTGTGGIGKTRLALQVAAEVSDQFADGVFFVALAPVSDEGLVVPTIMQTLSIKEAGEQPLLTQLKAALKEAFATAWSQGRTSPLEQIIHDVLKMRGKAGKQ